MREKKKGEEKLRVETVLRPSPVTEQSRNPGRDRLARGEFAGSPLLLAKKLPSPRIEKICRRRRVVQEDLLDRWANGG